ncbi:chemotaxis protein CheA [Kineococcus glutinatus]|uniref:histidine kinase n=1 Tax=Kineococcus glutinatus TaxID=1070872 RepID=A0ABP8VB86_9ACTN
MSNPLLVQFVAESADLLADVDDGLLRLEQDPGDRDLVNAVFRAAHTFKGSSGLFDLPELTRLTHAAEDLLDAVRSGTLALEPAMVDGLLAAFDAVRRWMPAIESTGRVPAGADAEGEAISSRLRTFLGDGTGTAAGAPPATATPATVQPLPEWVRDLDETVLTELRTWLDLTGSTLRAARYTPDSGCFFRGEDPLGLVRQVPAVENLAITTPQPLAGIDEIDEYDCVLQFTLLTRAGTGELGHVFRYVPDQLATAEVCAENLGWLLDGTGPTAEATGGTGEPDPAAAARAAELTWYGELLRAQTHVLAAGAGDDETATATFDARTRAAGHAALRVAAALGEDTTVGAEVLADALAFGDTGELQMWITGLAVGAVTDADHATRAAGAGAPPAGAAAPAATPTGTPDAPAPEHAERAATTEDATPTNRVLKVEQAKVDQLLDLVGELVVAKNALPFVAQEAEDAGARALARRLRDEFAAISRVSEELQQAVMDVRMLPVSTAFARVPRLVRDLSRKLGKNVRLVQEGEDTAADKDVIEMLAEPLVHLVRNSLDHGIETPADREGAGKPAEATLTLRAAPDGDAVVVEIVDDGRGIDTDKVRRKAYERGIIDEAALESMADDEAAQLIFAPGFSTADQISDVSGRGVGMDAVRSSIERLGGSVSTVNARGQGLTVRLRLPLTMAVSRVLLITAGGQRFGVPLDDVVETVRTERTALTRVAGRPVLALREEILPLSSLGSLLDIGGDLDAEHLNVLVVRTPTGPLGLVVDRFHQNTDVILKPLEGLLAATPGYCGTALLGDGLVLLVLDVKELNTRATAAR